MNAPLALRKMNTQQTIAYLARASFVRRYHNRTTNQTDTVGRHSFMVLWLAWYLAEGAPSADLLMAAAHHDVPEAIVSDLSAPIKRVLNAEAPGIFGRLEEQVREASGVPDYHARLSPREKIILRLADRLEGALFTAQEAFGLGNHALLGVYHRYRDYLREILSDEDPAINSALRDRAIELMSAIDQTFLTAEDTEDVVFG